jgi:hypothetical protein
MKNWILFASLIAIMSSCSFKQNVSFNKNWSGSMNCELDMRQMLPMMKVEGGEKAVSIIEEPETVEKIELLKATKGVSKVNVKEVEKGLYAFSYEFDDLNSLNKSANIMFSDSSGLNEFVYFNLKDRNTILFTMPKKDAGSPESEISEEPTGMEGFNYELSLKFPRKIASIETKNNAKISDNGKEINYTFDILSMETSSFSPDILIKLKKK